MKLSFPEGHRSKVHRDQYQYVPICRVWFTDPDSHGFALNLLMDPDPCVRILLQTFLKMLDPDL